MQKGLKRWRKVMPYDRCDCLQHMRVTERVQLTVVGRQVVDETSYAVILHHLLERWHKRCELPEIVNLFEPV